MDKEITKLIKTRIYNVIPAATWQMERILNLLEIIADDSIPTACVDCSVRPSLRINPKFIAEYCKTDEHLMMLILHEIFHIVLGHTRLFDRLTPIHNIAFDAIINSQLCHQFKSKNYVSFFENINGLDSLESRLLRPPNGWPDKIIQHPSATYKERKVISLLYGKDKNQVTYQEIFELLLQSLSGKLSNTYVLLGNHDNQSQSEIDKAIGTAVREITSRWPRPDKNLGGRDEGQNGTWILKEDKVSDSLRSAIKSMIKKSGIIEKNKNVNFKYKNKNITLTIETVIPQAKDRRLAAWKKIHGAYPIIYRGTLEHIKKKRTPVPIAHVYMDVSGSMNDVIGPLGSVLRESHKDGDVKLYAFSTVIDEITPAKIKKGIKNTFGTDINCILSHIYAMDKKKRPKKILVVSDGFIGKANGSLLSSLTGIKLYAGLTRGGYDKELRALGFTIYPLPI